MGSAKFDSANLLRAEIKALGLVLFLIAYVSAWRSFALLSMLVNGEETSEIAVIINDKTGKTARSAGRLPLLVSEQGHSLFLDPTSAKSPARNYFLRPSQRELHSHL